MHQPLPDSARLISALDQLSAPGRVLELGCGDCRDVSAYLAAIRARRPCVFVGVDVDRDALRRARSNIGEAAREDAFLVLGDVTQLPLQGRFDLIVLRHPDVVRAGSAWQNCVCSLPTRLAPNGVVLATTYSVLEMDLLRGWLGSVPLRPLPLDQARLAPTGLVGRDRFVAIYGVPND